MEAALKQLGMGKWAVGGTKAIRQYDADRYEAERAERAAAGIVDFPGQDAANAAGEGGQPYDMFGAEYGAAYDAAGDRMDGDYTDGVMREEDY